MFYCIIFLSGETTFAVRLVPLPPCGFFVCRTRSKMKSMRFTALNFPLQTCNQYAQLPQPLTQLMPSHKSRAGDCLCTCPSPCTIRMAQKHPGGGVKPTAIGLELGERIILLVKKSDLTLQFLTASAKSAGSAYCAMNPKAALWCPRWEKAP